MFYSKYCASGNDFILTHTFTKKDRSETAKRLCNRNYGIGADGFIVLVPHSSCDFEWEFYNSDGSIAEMCGNGTRAVGLYAFHNGLCGEKAKLQTIAGEIALSIKEDSVKSQLSPYIIETKEIAEFDRNWWKINTGVPHLVTFEEELYSLKKEELSYLRKKYNANVNIGKVEGGKLFIRTYERGVEDETLACGTGMAALFLRGFLEKRVEKRAQITPASGEELFVEIEDDRLFFEGKVSKVADFII